MSKLITTNRSALVIQKLVSHTALGVFEHIATARPMPSTRMTGMPMAAAIVPGHTSIAVALHCFVALAGAEGATVIDSAMWTNLTGMKGIWTTLDLFLINADRQYQCTLRIGCEGDSVCAIAMIGHINGQKLGTRIFVLDHTVDLQTPMAQRNTVFISRVQYEVHFTMQT